MLAYAQQGRSHLIKAQNDFYLKVIKIISGIKRGQLSVILKIQPSQTTSLAKD